MTMDNIDQLMATVRAAFAPDADAATKHQAAAILRSALAVLDASPGAPLAPSAPAPATAAPDVLGLIVERFRPLLPTDVASTIPRLNLPMVPLSRR
jgi:hypothetical protein